MIFIQLNGKERVLKRPLTVRELLQEAEISLQAIAVAVNSEIIPRTDFEKIRICNRDQVEIIHPVGGG